MTEIFNKAIKFAEVNLIDCLIPIILTLISIELIFRKRFETKKALNLFRWLIISYATLTLGGWIIEFLLHPENIENSKRFTGSYLVIYWLMTFGAFIFPFTLLYNKLASSFFYMLVVSFFLQSGYYFERLVIMITSFHRDYVPSSCKFDNSNTFILGIVLTFIQGTAIAIIVLGVFEIIKRNKKYF